MLMVEPVMVRCDYLLGIKYLLWKSHLNNISSDINECATNNGNCSQICTNTVGSFICSCQPGFMLNLDNINCAGEYLD